MKYLKAPNGELFHSVVCIPKCCPYQAVYAYMNVSTVSTVHVVIRNK